MDETIIRKIQTGYNLHAPFSCISQATNSLETTYGSFSFFFKQLSCLFSFAKIYWAWSHTQHASNDSICICSGLFVPCMWPLSCRIIDYHHSDGLVGPVKHGADFLISAASKDSFDVSERSCSFSLSLTSLHYTTFWILLFGYFTYLKCICHIISHPPQSLLIRISHYICRCRLLQVTFSICMDCYWMGCFQKIPMEIIRCCFVVSVAVFLADKEVLLYPYCRDEMATVSPQSYDLLGGELFNRIPTMTII